MCALERELQRRGHCVILIKRVLTEDCSKQNALRLQRAIQKAGGVSRAADIIEQAISTGKPVMKQI